MIGNPFGWSAGVGGEAGEFLDLLGLATGTEDEEAGNEAETKKK